MKQEEEEEEVDSVGVAICPGSPPCGGSAKGTCSGTSYLSECLFLLTFFLLLQAPLIPLSVSALLLSLAQIAQYVSVLSMCLYLHLLLCISVSALRVSLPLTFLRCSHLQSSLFWWTGVFWLPWHSNLLKLRR